MHYRYHLPETIALQTTIEDHTSGVSIYCPEIRQLPSVELLCIANDNVPSILTLNPTAIAFICGTKDDEIRLVCEMMFVNVLQSKAPKHVIAINKIRDTTKCGILGRRVFKTMDSTCNNNILHLSLYPHRVTAVTV